MAVSVIAGQDMTYEWSTTCYGSNLTNATTESAHLAINADIEPHICEISVEVCGCSNCAESTGVVTVVDPGAGFVTGRGSIESPVGAFPDEPLLSGRANFRFVAKYANGASTPSGDASFNFKPAGLYFESLSYDWLTVTDSGCANFKGSGITDSKEHDFMLWACDSGKNDDSTDTFRIKISLNNDIVYDSKAGGTVEDYGDGIAKGNIKVRKAKAGKGSKSKSSGSKSSSNKSSNKKSSSSKSSSSGSRKNLRAGMYG